MTLEEHGCILLKGSIRFKPSACRIIAQVLKSLPPHLSNAGNGGAVSDNFCYFPKLTIQQAQPLHTVVDQVCRAGFELLSQALFFYSAQNDFC